ncbi:uncharacterized protein [Leptinotarsa decemlineata]|uniref:uncharacterized protein n=1 Tax=Leptinotarsa decemlineata TaxID=7539 RepID=UPI003D309178
MVINKVSDGGLSGAVKILCSDDKLANFSTETFRELQSKHPQSKTGICYQTNSFSTSHLVVNENEVRQAIMSFRTSSSGGLDSLRPSHLQDLISYSAGSAASKILSSLTALCNVLLSGTVNQEICPILFGASLCALEKKDGGIRPIAVGNVFHRLAAKLASFKLKEKLGNIFRPFQNGFGSPSGCEAVSHAARRYINEDESKEGTVFLKLDYENAFNMLNQDFILKSVQNSVPELYPFVFQCYYQPSILTFDQNTISSERGVQQGDPLAPALFCLSIDNIIKNLKTEFNAWYLDDGSLGGDYKEVLNALSSVIKKSKEIGFELNFHKCELHFQSEPDLNISRKFNDVAPGIKIIERNSLILLGSPLTKESFITFFEEKLHNFRIMSSRVHTLPRHVAFHLLKNCLTIPKLLHLMRCFPTWHHQTYLIKFDEEIRNTLRLLLNDQLESNAWHQASLPASYEGLGIRTITDLSLPTFLSSSYSVINMIDSILPPSFPSDNNLNEAEQLWISRTDLEVPRTRKNLQQTWDSPLIRNALNNLLDLAKSPIDKARIKAVWSKHAGAWLDALPVTSLGTLLDNESFRVAVGLRLGSNISVHHKCKCGVEVDTRGYHGLSCRYSPGRFSRHQAVNDVITFLRLLYPAVQQLHQRNCQKHGNTIIW